MRSRSLLLLALVGGLLPACKDIDTDPSPSQAPTSSPVGETSPPASPTLGGSTEAPSPTEGEPPTSSPTPSPGETATPEGQGTSPLSTSTPPGSPTSELPTDGVSLTPSQATPTSPGATPTSGEITTTPGPQVTDPPTAPPEDTRADTPAPSPTGEPTGAATPAPTPAPTAPPTDAPTPEPTPEPTDAPTPTPPTDADEDGYPAAQDCDDSDGEVNPGAAEVCNGIDDNCDGSVDPSSSTDAQIWYDDDDNDGYGNASQFAYACTQPAGFTSQAGDCDDGAAAVHPEAEEVCNGIDDNCDGAVDPGSSTGAPTWYADTDGDGAGDPDTTTTACAQPGGYVPSAGDCDDQDGDTFPGAVETCDGKDNDCAQGSDGADAWWDEAWPYRVPITVSFPAVGVPGAPVAVDINFAGLLTEVGAAAPVEVDALRLVLPDCEVGQPVIPSQFLDDWQGVFAKADPFDPAGDSAGALVFVYDTDGDLSSRETPPAGGSVTFHLYFASEGDGTFAAPVYTTDVAASGTALSAGDADASFDAARGGMLSSFTLGTSPNMMNQASSCCGNSFYGGSWNIDPQDGAGTLTLLEDGPLFVALEASGSRADGQSGYTYTYTYFMFAGRPELWSRVHQVTDRTSTLSHSGSYTSGIRPWEAVRDALTGTGAVFSQADDSTWADVSNTSLDYGVTWAYATPPTYITSGLANYNPYIIAIGNDFSAGGSPPGTLPAGTAFMDHIVQIVLPHRGAFTEIQGTLDALIDGASPAVGAPQALE